MLDREVLRHQLVSRRTFLLAGGKISLLAALLSRIFYLQLIKGNEYKILSDKNRINLVMLPPNRGIICDRNEVILADNRASFSLKLDRRQAKSYKKSLETLINILSLSENEQKDIYNKIKKHNYKAPISLLYDLSWKRVSVVEERIFDLPAIYVDEINVRRYIFPEPNCHITGYVGKVNEQELQESGQSENDFQVGKSGIEKQYEKVLQGKFGYRKLEVDAHGLYVNQIQKIDSIQGNKIELNIDSKLQEYLHSIMEPQGSSVIVMDVNNGELIASASMPTYNPNDFVLGISQKEWKKLTTDQFKPLINKTVQTQYPPGSTFKLITVLAALEAGIAPSQTFFCSGVIMLGNKEFRCWHLTGHGKLDMIEAIKHSCNCYMYNIAKLIGVETILSVASRFGFGEQTGVDIPGELKGFIPSRAWKIKKFKFDWSLGDAFNISIGQGPLLSTPMQQIRMVAAIANGGKLITPRIAKEHSLNIVDVGIKPEHLDIIRKGMYKVMNEEGGTAYRYRPNNLIIAGKTGTSQVQAKKHANHDLSSKSIRWERRNHALFAGYAPFDSPKYAINVIVDHGGGGGRTAAPIAAKTCENLYSFNSL